MFDSLSDRLQSIFRNLKGQGHLTEANIQDALREVRKALLEADVNFRVAKRFVERIRDKALGQEVLQSLTPGQQVVKLVRDELVELLGGGSASVNFDHRPTVIMLVGLQGSGKTTTAGKLAQHLSDQRRKSVLLVPADIQRPAAIDQLHKVGKAVGHEVWPTAQGSNPVNVCREAVEDARRRLLDLVVLDTAGRLHVDQDLMDELIRIRDQIGPQEILFVADSMTGQDAVTSATEFEKALGLTGVILTKLDGDARGGAALSIREVTGRPIKFVGVGEKYDQLEVFHPDRLASRILGMGDVLSLVEKASATFEQEEAERVQEKLRKAEFSLEDFRDQLQKVRKIGPLDQLLSMVPGMGGAAKALSGIEGGEEDLVRIEAMINSMTPDERRNPAIINGSRRKRIARGSGTRVSDLNRMLKDFHQSRKLLRSLSTKGKKGLGRLKLPI